MLTRIGAGPLANAGVDSQMELGMRFALWAASRPTEPSIAEIRQEFGVSRATAYRYLSAWRFARADALTGAAA